MQRPLTIEAICTEITDAQKKKHDRIRSWEYCYAFFRNHKEFREDTELLDKAALHLGFFLASWGMLRGSSFLLQLDYTYYKDVVLRVLLDQKYDALWSTDAPETHANLLFELVRELTQTMRDENGFEDKTPTDTLITKIIMATMGCTPAYDIHFKRGLRIFLTEKGAHIGNSFTEASFAELATLSKQDSELCKIYSVSIPTMIPGINYTPMKLLDLYFWQTGYDDRTPLSRRKNASMMAL